MPVEPVEVPDPVKDDDNDELPVLVKDDDDTDDDERLPVLVNDDVNEDDVDEPPVLELSPLLLNALLLTPVLLLVPPVLLRSLLEPLLELTPVLLLELISRPVLLDDDDDVDEEDEAYPKYTSNIFPLTELAKFRSTLVIINPSNGSNVVVIADNETDVGEAYTVTRSVAFNPLELLSVQIVSLILMVSTVAPFIAPSDKWELNPS